MTTFTVLRDIDVKQWRTLPELVAILSDVRSTARTFKELEIPVPEVIESNERRLLREIESYRVEANEDELRRLNRELDLLKPMDERKAEMQVRQDALAAKLGRAK